MLNINKVEVQVSDESVRRATDFIKSIWFGSPRWLRILLCSTLFIGAAYFLYNRLVTAGEVDQLHSELKAINEKCQQTVFVDSYAYDVNNFIIVARAVDNELQNMYEITQQVLEFELEYISRNRPNDPSLVTVRRLIQQNKFAKESFDNIIQHNLKMYEEWIYKVKNNDSRNLNEVGRYHTGLEKQKK